MLDVPCCLTDGGWWVEDGGWWDIWRIFMFFIFKNKNEYKKLVVFDLFNRTGSLSNPAKHKLSTVKDIFNIKLV